MFERYTERARRVLFFARYEASQLGSISIETEHLLLGLVREGKGLAARIFARAHLPLADIRREIESRSAFREKVSTSVEIPFSAGTKRALVAAAEEADRLLHDRIGTEHLLLGILRDERSVAASILMERGMRLQTVRDDSLQLHNEQGGIETDREEVERPSRHMPAPIVAVKQLALPTPAHAAFRHRLPDFLPSRVVHITHAHSFYSPTQGPAIAHGSQPWFALGRTLTQIVAFAWGSEESQVSLAAEQLDFNARYDFTIVLPSADSPEIIPRLLREAIERDFNVEVSREDGDPPTLIIKSR